MDRILRAVTPAKPRKTAGEHLLYPGEESWEWRSLDPVGTPGPETALSLTDARRKIRTGSRVAIPLQHVVVFPLWLATTDPSLMKDMVFLQLERRGLLDHTRAETVLDYQVIRKEGERTLLSVSVLTAGFPEDLCFPSVTDYRLAADFIPLPANHLIIWKELGHLVLAFTSGTALIHVQVFQAAGIQPSVIQEAMSARLILEAEGSVPLLAGVLLYGDLTQNEAATLGHALSLPVRRLARPALIAPAVERKLLPPSVRTLQQHHHRRQQQRKLWLAGAAVYALLVLVFLGQWGWLLWQKSQLTRNLALHRQEVEVIKRTSQRWRSLQLAVLPETYPIELLYRCTRLLPEEGVRLVAYDQNGTRVLLSGESKNAPAAFQFSEALKKSPDLTDYTWEMPAPKLLPNDSAQFQIEGKRQDAITPPQ